MRATNNTINYEKSKAEEDLRSVRSEFDYSNKKNFVELLGQKQLKTRQNNGAGLHSIHLGQQLVNLDDENYRRDKHSGVDRTYKGIDFPGDGS